MTNREFQILKQQRDAKLVTVLTKIIDTEWNRVSRQLDALDTDSTDVTKAAILIGQYQILDKLMAALSEGSLSSDYEIEAIWRSKLVQRVVEGFNLDIDTRTPPRKYKSIAQQLAEACGLEVIQD
ncbi:MAG: hypothetical protein O4861_24240 [Trichodesmium sp. St16_bin4-tuft]|uniref:Uncharacterized protein n=1 Tax=Trichodesmium erythraeum (strain IMS101) TaxID=203124 RepID=Q10X07_TRIEI|nr:hypothetical protein [Trichodesmium erythraeum GBRTRLIN201]MCH2047365.1 hypothetical protein [Trichodesmium sp. ALOHA_ZT_67]MCL2927305.1 hypothetical protein [Trichodesmium sp. MAG_R01]MDE5068469.1 hypothetical protein [Trichodesmium sp. St4_bin8_1]MDE5072077.1 hypothetical protein [Trichodesmium sp. St5_bin8]MDE5078888.1 hypothetical protein [Trichodesmium sp. St2_bin6]MDE5090827.1 hypothetical protein [Trichodesmium sp. St18_bin3_1_1]MDE5095288.1 hypothetical protein [Trichodesmium sp. 